MKLEKYDKRAISMAMIKRKLTQKELAEQLNRAPQTINKAINGKSMIFSEKLNAEIVEALQPDLDQLQNYLDEERLPGEPSQMIDQSIAPGTLAMISGVS